MFIFIFQSLFYPCQKKRMIIKATIDNKDDEKEKLTIKILC